MARSLLVALGCLVTLASSSCTTDVCACSPPMVPALVTGRVVDERGAPVSGAQVRAYSAPAAGCHSLEADFGFATAESDGGFYMELGWDTPQNNVCVLVFAGPPGGSDELGNSDTTLLALNFSDELAPDSARVELILRAR